MITEPYKIIVFPGGCSGNFLADWLTLNESTMRNPTYQIDAYDNSESLFRWIRFSDQQAEADASVGLDLNSISEEDKSFLKERISIIKKNPVTDVTVTHITDDRLRDMIDWPATYIKIWFKSDVYTSIRNNFFKDLVGYSITVDPRVSRFEHYLNYISYQYDSKINLPIPPDSHDLVDILNIEYLKKIFAEINLGKQPSQNKINWAKEYLSKQRVIQLGDLTNYHELRERLQPKDTFDLAILLHAYETRNPSQRRIWSIDDIPDEYNAALDFLNSNHDRYY